MSSRQIELPLDVRQELDNQSLRVKPFAMAKRLWERVLTAAERECLGDDLAEAYRKYNGTAGMWMHVRHVSRARAVLEVAKGVGSIDQASFDWLMREIGEVSSPAAETVQKPKWDKDSRRLFFGSQIARHFTRPKAAKNILRIVKAFEEDGWPCCIDDPLPGADSQRLHTTIRSLNKGLRFIYFHSDGSGQGLCWKSVGDDTT